MTKRIAWSVSCAAAAIALLGVAPSYATKPVGRPPQSSLAKVLGRGCNVPLPPSTIRSRAQPGHWYNRRSPAQIGLYYLSAVFARHYRILSGGFGGSSGPNGGSGFGFRAHRRRCGYFSVGGGGRNGNGTFFEVCAGKRAAVMNRCTNPHGTSTFWPPTPPNFTG